MSSSISGIEIELSLVQGRNLVAKDSGGLLGKKSSDPYAVIYWGGEERGRTQIIEKTVNPGWNATFKFKFESNNMEQLLKAEAKYSTLDIVVFDNDKVGKDDPLGTVTIPLSFTKDPTNVATWYPLGKGTAPNICNKASGELDVKLAVTVDRGVANAAKQEQKIHSNEPSKDTLIANIPSPMKMPSDVTNIEMEIKITGARNLIGKDSSLLSKTKNSDPYAIIYWRGKECGRTRTIKETMNPEWNETFKIKFGSNNMQQLLGSDPKFNNVDIVLFDQDKMVLDKLSKDDPLGTVTIPLNFGDKPTNLPSAWYPIGSGAEPYFAKKVSGELGIALTVTVNNHAENGTQKIFVEEKVISKETSKNLVVTNQQTSIKMSSIISNIEIEITILQGRNLMAKDSSLFSKKKTSDPYAIIYWGGEECGRTKTIDNNLNPKWNETFEINVGPKYMQQLLVRDPKYSTIDIVVFDHDKLILDKLNKDDPLGTISIPAEILSIEEMQSFPATWHSLGKGKDPYMAECHNASGDLEVKYKVTVTRSMSKIMQIEEATRLRDDFGGKVLTMHLEWDAGAGPKAANRIKKIRPHASAICFDEALNLVDIASFNDAVSSDGAIKHLGLDSKSFLSTIGKKDNIEQLGQDIELKLDQISPNTAYICFLINSFNGRNMDKACSIYSFTLGDPETKSTIASYTYSKSQSIGRHTALLMCCLYRDKSAKGWMLRTIIEVAPGIITNQVVDVLQSVVHDTIASYQPSPMEHSSGPRAELVVEC